MPSSPFDVAGSLPPPSGQPLPSDLAPPPPPVGVSPPTDPATPGPVELDPFDTDRAGTERPDAVPARRINPDVIVPVGAWPEGTWDPEPEPGAIPEPVGLTAGSAPADDGASDAPSPWAVTEDQEEPSPFRAGAERAAPLGREPATVTAMAERTDRPGRATAVGPTASTPRRGFVARQPRWTKVGAGAAVLFAAAAAISVVGGDDGDRPSVAPASVTAVSTIATAAPAPTSPAPGPTTAAPPSTTTPPTAAPTTAAPTTATTAPATTSAPTSVAPTTAVTAPPGTPAAEVLAAVSVAAERTNGFSIAQFPTDPAVSGEGCDVLQQVLARDSRTPVAKATDAPCTVVSGSWVSPYDGVATEDPAALALDRTVSLREAWESGAALWTPGQRAAFAGDVADARTARVATAALVRAKGDRDPTAWLPAVGPARCAYVADWLAVKARWGLAMDRAEADRVAAVIDAGCPDLRVAASAPLPPEPVVPTPTTVPYYLDCVDAASRGATSIPRGTPGYRDALDGNGNGIACE